MHVSGNSGDLPYGCIVIIWSNYLEILEEEVLNIVRFVTDMNTISQESLLKFSENLVTFHNFFLKFLLAVALFYRSLVFCLSTYKFDKHDNRFCVEFYDKL